MREAAVMITGGSGCLGQQVIRRLAERKMTVVAVYHHKLPEALEGVYPVCADFSSAELMAAPLRGVDTVVHMAWEGGLTGPAQQLSFDDQGWRPETNNLRMLRHLVTAMERAGTKRIILLSAAGASRTAEAPFLREKYAAEALVLNSQIPQKQILRSAVMWGGVGANDRLLRSMLRILRYPIFPLPNRSTALAPVHVSDLAGVVALACSQQQTDAAVLQDVHGGQLYTVAELFKMVSERYIRSPRLAIGGLIGESLLPLFERDKGQNASTTKLRHLLAIGNSTKSLPTPVQVNGPVPKKRLASFQERMLEM